MDERTHKIFQDRLRHSIEGAVHAARWLGELGYFVQIRPTTVAETYQERRQHLDGGDLYVLGNGHTTPQRIEAKRLTAQFTCREDWPFGNRYIVCSANSWDMSDPKPRGYIHISDDFQYCGIVEGGSSDLWYKDQIKDRETWELQDFYLINTDKVTFRKIGLEPLRFQR